MFTALKKLIKKFRNKHGFPAYRSGWNMDNNYGEVPMSSDDLPNQINSSGTFTSGGSSTSVPKDERLAKKPVELVDNIVTEEPKMNLTNLKGQIKCVERRLRLLKEVGSPHPDEVEALRFLKARTKYEKTKSKFAWGITTQALIADLCSKYKVQVVSFGGYYKCVPNEALDELEKFMKAYESVCGDLEPVLKLIVDYGGKETKKDPILLAGSPFGRWYYILGAWDKEVEIVDDLLYNGK